MGLLIAFAGASGIVALPSSRPLNVSFISPLFPFLPLFAIAINLYLLASLDKWTWVVRGAGGTWGNHATYHRRLAPVPCSALLCGAPWAPQSTLGMACGIATLCLCPRCQRQQRSHSMTGMWRQKALAV